MCPNFALLKSYKVYPRKIDFNYMRDRFFIYVYLNPFKELRRPLTARAGGKEYCFAYEPIYVGKGTGAGYRQNQHLQNFKNDRESNIQKVKALSEIQKKMAEAVAKQDHSKPWNWQEYKDGYIVILEVFPDARHLLNFEIELINDIGTIYDHKGPLTNKIKNAYKYDFVDRTGNGQVL